MYVGKWNGVVNAKCPYYQSEGKYNIRCEGIVEGTNTINEFPTEKEKDDYLKENCLTYPSECMIMKCLEKKYEQGC